MGYNMNTLLPYIPSSDYDKVATEFLETYYPNALYKPQPVPILDVAKNKMDLDVQFLCLSEELDIYGMTIFDDGLVEFYDLIDGIYDTKGFKRKTILIDPEAVKKTNIGCQNNTIAHECVHWYKHRMYYKMQKISLPRQAKLCKCSVRDLPTMTEDEEIMENQATGIAPKILMPKRAFEEFVSDYDIRSEEESWREISDIARFFKVSKQSVKIRLQECGIL